MTPTTTTVRPKGDSQLLERIAATIGELPTSPAVVSAVMGLTADLNTEITKLARALSADPALTAKVLRISNSPFYGRARSVSSLDEAVMILGFFTIRSLVVATSAYSMFKRNGGDGLEHSLWEHSLAVAMGARITARRLNAGHVDEVFLAGLLHDIGVLILLQKMPREYRGILDTARKNDTPLIELEKEKLGFNHVDLGVAMLERWNFPPFLVESIRLYRNPEVVSSNVSPADLETVKRNAHIVCFADELAKTLGYDFHATIPVEMGGAPCVKALNLSPDCITNITEELTERFAEEQSLFEG
ncbi:MAG: HDOD domain-containing protein [Candidatus Zixiibacteriota bacterium]